MLHTELFGVRPFIPHGRERENSIVILHPFGGFLFLRQQIVQQVRSHVDDFVLAHAVVREFVEKAFRALVSASDRAALLPTISLWVCSSIAAASRTIFRLRKQSPDCSRFLHCDGLLDRFARFVSCRWTCANGQAAKVNFVRSDDSGLLIVAHGSTVNPDSSAPTLAHAAEIRRNIFTDVECAFWKEEPSLRDALFLFDPESIRKVCVVPNFISEGYFTQTVVPRELELNGPITKRSNGQIWRYCEPVGNHSLMTELLLNRARDVAPDVDPAETSLLIVAHGTDLNENSAVAAKREVEKIRSLGKYAEVLNVYMEESPLVSDWRKLAKTHNVVVVPFFDF